MWVSFEYKKAYTTETSVLQVLGQLLTFKLVSVPFEGGLLLDVKHVCRNLSG